MRIARWDGILPERGNAYYFNANELAVQSLEPMPTGTPTSARRTLLRLEHQRLLWCWDRGVQRAKILVLLVTD